MLKSIKETSVPDIIIDYLGLSFAALDEVIDLHTAGAEKVKEWLEQERSELEDDVTGVLGYGYVKFLEDNLQEVVELIGHYVEDEIEEGGGGF